MKYEFDNLTELLASGSAKLDVAEFLPVALAKPIHKLSVTANLRPECYLLALLVQCSSLLKIGTSTIAYPQIFDCCVPNYFGAIVTESPHQKTAIMQAIIDLPMQPLQEKARQEFEQARVNYKQEKRSKPPVQKIYSFTKATLEKFAAQVEKMPQQSLLWICNDLGRTFKSASKYQDECGSDLLDYWDGGCATILTARQVINVENMGVSIFGDIQPKALAGFLVPRNGKLPNDNGKFAQFDFIQQPLTATELHIDAPRIDLTLMLTALYEKLDSLPVRQFEFDLAAKQLFIGFHNHCEDQKVAPHSKPGMKRAVWRFAPEKVVKLATILHCIYAVQLSEEPSSTISPGVVRAAIKFVNFTIGQI